MLGTQKLNASPENIIHDGVSFTMADFMVKYVTEFTVLTIVKFSDIK